MKWRVGLTQRVFEEATVEVEAETREEAEAKARKLARLITELDSWSWAIASWKPKAGR